VLPITAIVLSVTALGTARELMGKLNGDLHGVVPREIRNAVMESINEKHGLQSEAGAMVCAMDVDEMVHLG